MYGQRDLEVISNLSENGKRPKVNFGVKKFDVKKDPKKTFVFEGHNFMDPIEIEGVIF